MQTNDDYGRRERLLLHQNPTSQYGISSVSGSNIGISGSQSVSNNNTGTSSTNNDISNYQKQQYQQSESRASPSTTTSQECYQTACETSSGSNERDQSNEPNNYGAQITMDKYEKQTDKLQSQQFDDTTSYGDQSRSISSCCERFSKSQNSEKFNQSSICSGGNQNHHQYSRQQQSTPQNSITQFTRYSEINSVANDQRLLFQSTDCFQRADRFQSDSTLASTPKTSTVGEYANSGILALSTSKPFSPETFPSPPSPAPTNDRFVPPPPLSPSPSEKYASTHSLANYPSGDRILRSGSPNTRDRYGTAPASPILKNRFTSAEKLLAVNSTSNTNTTYDAKDQQQRYTSSTERLLVTGSPVLGGLQRDSVNLFPVSSANNESNRYPLSPERLVTSSPMHAPVPERFASKVKDRFILESPNHERYQRQESSGIHHERFSTISNCERYISNSQNPESAHNRYSSTERALVSTSTSETLQSRCFTSSEQYPKYSDRNDRCTSSNSPAPTEYSCRYSAFQDTSGQARYSTDRFNDLTLQRYSQSRTNDRFNERYLTSLSPTHDGRINSESNRYASTSSTERLLVSSSPSSSENSRYQNLYTTSGQMSNDRFVQQSPTLENNSTIRSYQNQTSTKSDKFIQVSKSVSSYDRYQLTNPDKYDHTNQERIYGFEKYSSSTIGNDRYQGSEQRYHGNSENYSPARVVGDKYLSLPKPKDTYPTGRIISSCSSVVTGNEARGFGNSSGVSSYVPPNAHTPVERYVPQPPPEVLFPDRYVDRYGSSAAHTPTDRYVPTADPGDPYMRRDLGFHHHYRLPPPGYPYHQTHFRFRGFAYASPGRLGGSPGSSSSSSSTSVQREFSTSPSLRPKVRASAIEFTSNIRPSQSCCGDGVGGQRNCCQVRRSLPPGALSSIPSNQSAHSSWQQSPNSGTTGTSTISSSGTEVENVQSISMYPVGGSSAIGSSENPTSTVLTIVPSVPSAITASSIGTSELAITRSASAPAGPRPTIQPSTSVSTTATSTNQRPKLRRNMSRTEAIRNYIKKETATFFGVDEETEALEKQRWFDRRRRMASRKYGALHPEHKPPDPDITRDVPDSTEVPEDVVLRRWQQPVRRKDSVVRMTLSGLHYMVETLTKQRPQEKSESRPDSRSFPPSVISISQTDAGDAESISKGDNIVDDEEEAFFQKFTPPSTGTTHQQTQGPIDQTGVSNIKADAMTSSNNKHMDDTERASDRSDVVDELVRFASQKEERTVLDGAPTQIRRLPVEPTRDHYTSRTTSWRKSRNDARTSHQESTTLGQHQDDDLVLRRETTIGRTRISPNTIDRVFDNSNRRQYGMGIVGRFFGSFRKSVAHKPQVKKQLDDIEDHRPYFTYWITTVQVLVLIISLACYGFGPIGIDLHHRSGLVLVTSLSLQQVDYQEPANFWIGPRAADLIHLGAKFAPCMRRDMKILKEIDVWRERERDTACCIRNDDSGCVQSSKADCSIRGVRSTLTVIDNTISTWKKWGPGDNGPGGRISGSVCGLDPKFCDAPASIAPYEWPDDITKWPICRKTNPFSQRFRSNNGHTQGNNNFPVGRYKDKMAEHMVCEVIGHPCCIGIHGMCRITTKEYCDFVHGYFHEEASLCSQVECLHDVCGMIPFLHPEWPDQFYRLFTTTFLHAGILHLAVTLFVQYYLMRDLEKLTGSLRIALIYFTGALAGNLASAIFIPYRAEVGPAGAHFALLATLVVEVLNCWPILKHPRRALTKLIFILMGFLVLGVLPWVDNYAHFFGFIFGFFASYALLPFISFGEYDRRRKIILIWICLVLILGLFALLLALFYNIPVYECEICKLFNCIPFTRDFCASQNINFMREEPV
ncbi:inactive rhomboid protein 1 isoform X2 [Microplitis mediator]|uniref:inactive rhomboid protein 1 isoform X2 n=1 Tax=Microplitis mediator TaxID=375433 RepID=UPI0025555490|nr:inactive rhomboid protein 1 isoform X2 [Microplitis mediator]